MRGNFGGIRLKYFTRAWWGREGPADPDPVPLYRAYFDSIRAALPADLVAAQRG
jgi:hypothetical protein